MSTSLKILRLLRLLIVISSCAAVFQLSADAKQPTEQCAIANGDVAKWREDLRFMAQEMPRYHRNLFHSMTREQFDAAVAKLEERIPALCRHQIIVGMARIVAMVGDGHTNIAPTRDPKIGFRAYPIKLYFFKDGLYVRAATVENANLVGARVVRIGNAPVEKAYDAVREIIGRDNEMDAKFFAAHLLVMPEVLHALGLIDDMESASFSIERNGKQKEVRLSPAGPADMMPPDTDLSWIRKAGWIDARDGASEPSHFWLKDPTDKFRFEYLPSSKTIYVQFNQVGNKSDESIEAFSKRLIAFIDANAVERLILDLRLNRGGNGELNRPLLLAIIRSSKIDQRGKLFTIIGRSTFSAAQFLTNEMERYTETIFVGEPSGGKINSYGDSRKITLPNSGITVRVSTLWWQGDERDTRQWTAPDIAAELTFEDYRTNIDPALNAALSYAPKPSLRQLLADAVASGPQALTARFREWKLDPANAYVDAEPQLNALGYELLSAKQLEQAIEVFKLDVATFPQSANGYDSLGEAYMVAGNKEMAIRSYEKALALNPKLYSARDALKKLRGP